jgi:hypothetical protein
VLAAEEDLTYCTYWMVEVVSPKVEVSRIPEVSTADSFAVVIWLLLDYQYLILSSDFSPTILECMLISRELPGTGHFSSGYTLKYSESNRRVTFSLFIELRSQINGHRPCRLLPLGRHQNHTEHRLNHP